MDRNFKLAVAALAVLTVLIAGYLYGSGSQSGDSLTALMDAHGYELETEGNYSVTEVSEEKVAGIPVTEIEAVSGDSRVSASIYAGVDSGFAASYIQDRRQELAAIYTDTPAPYEGIPGRDVHCPDRFVPALGENSTGDQRAEFSLYSDAERQIGACSNSTAEYRTEISILYCPESDMIASLETSRPIKDGEVLMEISCK